MTLLKESVVKPQEVETYGSDMPEYQDQKIGFHAMTRSYYLVAPMNEGFLMVAVSRIDGLVRFTYTNSDKVGRMIHSPAFYRKANVTEALKYMPYILYLLTIILNKYYMRLPQVKLVSSFTMMTRQLSFLVRSPALKVLMKKYKFKKHTFKEEETKDGQTLMVHTFTKE